MISAKLQLLKETFESKFDIDKFKRFTREFFNEPEMLSAKRHIGIWKEYENNILSYSDIAKFNDSEGNKIIILAVELKSEKGVERARSIQRNFISKILDKQGCEAAIVAFYSEEDVNWRLSFVRLDYTFKEKGLELDLTPAKRYSYLVGENETSHTAQKQLYPIFENDKDNPKLDEIEAAFSVEKVTKDFFEQYKNKYYDLKEYLEKDEAFINESLVLGFEVNKFSEQFAKKLMGQLAFLYFLQKKGWLGVRIMPQNHSIEKAQFMEIYNAVDDKHKEILKKLFINGKDGKVKLAIKAFYSIEAEEANLLSDCFINSEFNMPWGSGDKKFIRGIYDFCNSYKNKNFFDDYLEPFFYEALNKRRKNQYYKNFNCKIPFLNGGLFEPLEGYHWKQAKFEIPNSIFSNIDEKGREADGILDIFDRYNFTMNEDEPLEKEVAVDPEMLGKIFENLLDGKDRKSKGAFYTPREIVHYMCQESLTNYLVNKVNVPYADIREFILYGELIRDADNRSNVGYGKEFTIKQTVFDKIVQIDEALKNIRVADPAVGSGAFPLGMLNEIVRARNNITEYLVRLDKTNKLDRKYGELFIRKWRSQYKMKWDTIKNCIFAVDIEPSAVDIAKLRLWLSVVVEQEIDEENVEPHPLPNLDCNIMVGNSLVDEYEGIKLFDESLLHKYKNNNLKEESETYSQIASTMQMSLLIDHSDDMLKEMFEYQDMLFGEDDETKKKQIKVKIDKIRDDLIEYKLTKDGNREGLKKYEEMKKLKMKPYFIWELEFAKVFKDNGGFDVVIGNPPYGAKFDKKNKNFLQKKYPSVPDYESADYFVCKTEELLRSKGIISYIIPNTILANVFAEKIRKQIINNWRFINVDNLSTIDVFESATVRNCILTLLKEHNSNFNCKFINAKIDNSVYIIDKIKIVSKDYLNDNIDNWLNIFYHDEETISIINKIKKLSTPLSQFTEISQGLIPYDKYRGHSKETIKNRIWHSNFKKDDTYRMELQGKDLNRYSIRWNGKTWISYGEWLAAPRKKEFFTEPRILIREITNPRILASYTCEEYYNTPSIINIINFNSINSKYVLGLINSKLISFYHNNTSSKANKGIFPKILVNDVRNIPIVLSNEKTMNFMIELVEQALSMNQEENEKVDKMKLDSKIDNLVYKIYELSDEEINKVENYFKKKEA
ncbi:Eco57I restriction-modification methylase domain-containing protein [Clostridium guangxiense]|uniref:Eco57I restriction-modification methylase domain-containing protein n=1 Tax=Clostridium guangxiense TaxID=1662055 RepID=UPI001E533510|nr:TaqI-like C-terminal specificity domain-containing protein [Clostridium guangxiense]MCD2347403.1 N-6 DNA methylase [Clostridium guangxiense]